VEEAAMVRKVMDKAHKVDMEAALAAVQKVDTDKADMAVMKAGEAEATGTMMMIAEAEEEDMMMTIITPEECGTNQAALKAQGVMAKAAAVMEGAAHHNLQAVAVATMMIIADLLHAEAGEMMMTMNPFN